MTTADDKTKVQNPHEDIPGFTPETLNVHPDLKEVDEAENEWPFGEFTVSTHHGRDAFWIVVRKAGNGGVALRTQFFEHARGFDEPRFFTRAGEGGLRHAGRTGGDEQQRYE